MSDPTIVDWGLASVAITLGGGLFWVGWWVRGVKSVLDDMRGTIGRMRVRVEERHEQMVCEMEETQDMMVTKHECALVQKAFSEAIGEVKETLREVRDEHSN